MQNTPLLLQKPMFFPKYFCSKGEKKKEEEEKGEKNFKPRFSLWNIHIEICGY